MKYLLLPFMPRYALLTTALVATGVLAAIAWRSPDAGALVFVPLLLSMGVAFVGIRDFIQPKHAILRNYPVAAHLRFLFEHIRPELRQYFFESDKEGMPFPRDKRSIVYQRAKRALDKRPFGTQYDVYRTEYEWLHHSMVPKPIASEPFRILIGEANCSQPYSCSVLNISAMSFGSLSANAIRALNKGAKIGGFAHTTGEGGFSPYHREHGGDVVWQLGTGYFGCRTPDGRFSPERFQETAALPQIKMIEVKLSQGAKPGLGGILPAAKVTSEIARIRGVAQGKDCVSPPGHGTFSTPIEMLHFLVELRRLSGGKPIGFKLCVGHPREFLALVKAMVETNLTPDFIVVDGAEGGTGAAPLEFTDHVGMPLREGLSFVHASLVGANVRHRIKLGASGKITSAFDMARVMALGADWCNSARGFMFAVGCIQAQTCHTGKCPTGVATQDRLRQRGVVVADKAERVANFHRETVKALAELIAASGLCHPTELRPEHLMHRISPGRVMSYAEQYRFLAPGELLAGTEDPRFRDAWAEARADSFALASLGRVPVPVAAE